MGELGAGVLVEPNGPAALADGLGRLLEDGPRRTSLGMRAIVRGNKTTRGSGKRDHPQSHPEAPRSRPPGRRSGRSQCASTGHGRSPCRITSQPTRFPEDPRARRRERARPRWSTRVQPARGARAPATDVPRAVHGTFLRSRVPRLGAAPRAARAGGGPARRAMGARAPWPAQDTGSAHAGRGLLRAGAPLLRARPATAVPLLPVLSGLAGPPCRLGRRTTAIPAEVHTATELSPHHSNSSTRPTNGRRRS